MPIDWEPTVALPGGTVTFLLTDIEGSTRLWQESPDAMRAAIERHDELLMTGIQAHSGTVLTDRGEGDSFFAVFTRASDAVRAACLIQATLRREPWPEGKPILVRMAIHAGEASGDYRGSAANRCARIRALAAGGDVLLSASVRELARDSVAGTVRLEDLGTHRLRDLDRPERIYRVRDATLHEHRFEPARRARSAHTSTLEDAGPTEFRILGPVEVWHRGRLLPLGGARQRALLALLLLRANEVVSTDGLIDAIWADHPSGAARNVLHAAIGKLRKVLGHGVLVTRPPGYMLRIEWDDLDATRFERLAARGRAALASDPGLAADRFRRALALFRGPVLADVAGESFVQGDAARLDEMRLSVLEDRIVADLALGEHAAVSAELERLVLAHPFRERLRAQLMLALYRSGRQADALRVYAAGRSLLANELRIDPGPELQRLEMAILRQDSALLFPIARDGLTGWIANDSRARLHYERALEHAMCPTFVGRDRELAALVAALDGAVKGQGSLVLIEGEAGLGKSRLATELCGRAASLGCQVIWGSCVEADLSMPYLPFLDAVGNHLAEADITGLRKRLGTAARELGSLFPQLGAATLPAGAGDSPQSKIRLFEAFLMLLRLTATDRGLVMVVEDVHWADASSRELLEYMTRRLRTSPILVLATCREEEMDRRHPLLPSFQSWLRAGVAELVRLRPLPQVELASMVRSILPETEVDEEFLDYLWQRSEGIPLVLEEMLREAIECGAFQAETGWSRRGIGDLQIPRVFADTVLRRLERLGEDPTRALQAAAVLGTSFDSSLLTAVLDADASKLATTIHECVTRLLVEPDPVIHGRYSFRHSLTRDAVYEDIIIELRDALHVLAAGALGAEPGARAVDIAHHLWAAGRTDEAIPATLRAADDAVRARAHSEAAELYERALPHIHDDQSRGRVLCSLGSARHVANGPREAIAPLEAGVTALEGCGLPAEAAEHRLRLGRCHWETGRPDLAYGQYELVRARIEPLGPSGTLADAYTRVAGMHVIQRDGRKAHALAERAVELAEAAGAGDASIRAHGAVGFALCCRGRIDEGLLALDQSYAEAQDCGLFDVAETVLFQALCYRAYWARPHEIPSQLEQLESLTPTAAVRSYVLRVKTLYEATAGDLRRAHDAVNALVEFEAGHGAAWAAPQAQTLLAGVLGEMGRAEEALDMLPEPGPERLELIGDSWIRLHLYMATGKADLAARIAELFLDEQPWDRVPFVVDGAVEAMVMAGRLVDAGRVIKCAGEPFKVAPARPWKRLSAARILLAQGDAPSARKGALAAAEAFGAAGALMDEARALELLARAEGAMGDVAAATVTLRRVQQTAVARGAGRHVQAAADLARELGVALPEAR